MTTIGRTISHKAQYNNIIMGICNSHFANKIQFSIFQENERKRREAELAPRRASSRIERKRREQLEQVDTMYTFNKGRGQRVGLMVELTPRGLSSIERKEKEQLE